jgi:hypothetical protein
MLRSDLTSALSASLGGTAENAIDLALEQTVIFAHGDFIHAYAPALMERELEPWITSAAWLHERAQWTQELQTELLAVGMPL